MAFPRKKQSVYGPKRQMVNLADALAKRGSRLSTILEFGMLQAKKRLTRLGCSDDAVKSFSSLATDALIKNEGLCESPIEQSMLSALLCADYDGFAFPFPAIHSSKDSSFPPCEIVIIPQFAFVRYRTDFMLVGTIGADRKMVAVECDGAGFHTEANHIRRDWDRDQYFKSWGIDVFRFSGAEIYQEAQICANKVAAEFSDWRRGLNEPQKPVA